jgi:hypothetical protein
MYVIYGVVQGRVTLPSFPSVAIAQQVKVKGNRNRPSVNKMHFAFRRLHERG